MSQSIPPGSVYLACRRIQPFIRSTPMDMSQALSGLSDCEVHLKHEHLQITGSFKLRGATNAVQSLSEDQKRAGVVGVSTGNHGRGLAHAAAKAGIRCVICMSDLVPDNKVESIRALGADVRIVGHSQDEAQEEVDRLVADEAMAALPPFDNPAIISGQGTVGLEIIEALPAVDTVLVPVSGGGLISGVALIMKAINPDISVIGISMERGAAMVASQRAGKPVAVEELASLADSLGGGIGLDNTYTFTMVDALVDDLITVTEAEIAAAIHHLYWSERQIVEGSGSVGVAALLSGKIRNAGCVVALLSGGNIDMGLHKQIIAGEEVDLMAPHQQRGRIDA